MARLGRLLAWSLLVPFTALISLGFYQDQGNLAKPVITPYKASGIYQLNEKVGWNITLPDSLSAAKYTYTIKANNHTTLASGEVDLSSRKGSFDVSMSSPGMLYVELTPPGGKTIALGAAVAPEKLKPVVARPADFDQFWNRKVADLKKVPMNPKITQGDTNRPEVDYSLVEMDHVNGTKVYGQLAKPVKKGKYPAIVVLQWASPPYPLDKYWATNHASGGWLVLNIQPHNVPVSGPPELYSNLPDEIKNYGALGQRDRDKNYFVEMYLRGYRAVDFLAQHPDWDGKTIAVTGGSMGGQQSFAVAGLHPKVTHMMANEPAGCDLNGPNFGRQNSYPFYPPNDPEAMKTAAYIDAVNFAPRIKATSLVSMGFIDTITAPAGIWTAFNLIKGPKVAAPMIEAAHNNIATWEQQQPYYTRQTAWMKALAEGKPVPLD